MEIHLKTKRNLKTLKLGDILKILPYLKTKRNLKTLKLGHILKSLPWFLGENKNPGNNSSYLLLGLLRFLDWDVKHRWKLLYRQMCPAQAGKGRCHLNKLVIEQAGQGSIWKGQVVMHQGGNILGGRKTSNTLHCRPPFTWLALLYVGNIGKIISGAGFFTYSINFIAIEPEFFTFSGGQSILSFRNKVFYFRGDLRFVATIRLYKPQGEQTIQRWWRTGAYLCKNACDSACSNWLFRAIGKQLGD